MFNQTEMNNTLENINLKSISKLAIVLLLLLFFLQIFIFNNYINSNTFSDFEFCSIVEQNNIIDKDNIVINTVDLPVIPEYQNLKCLNKIYQSSVQEDGVHISFAQNKIIYSYILYFLFLINFIFFLLFKERQYVFLFFLLTINFYIFLVADNTLLEIFLLLFIFLIPLVSSKLIIEKINLKLVLLAVLLLSAFLQQYHLSKEIIGWEISTYLSMGQDINRGNLPYESQFELKGALLFYIFSFIDLISNGDFRLAKILNDIPILLLTIIMFMTLQLKNKKYNTIGAILLYTSLLSIEYYGEIAYSEHHSLIPIAVSFYLLERSKDRNYFLIGILFSLATLINHGSVILFFSIVLYIFINNKKNLRNLFIGFSIPHLIFLFIYFINDLLNVYLVANLQIPLNYTGVPFSERITRILYGVVDPFTGLLSYNILLYISSLIIALFITYLAFNSFRKGSFKNDFTTIHYFFIACLIHLFILGTAPGRYNFIIYFFCLYIVNLEEKISTKFFLPLIIITSLSVFQNSYDKSFENITNYETIEENYQLQIIAQGLKETYNANSSSSVLALESHLILYYLDVPNASYVNHPTLIFINEVNVFDNPENASQEDVFKELISKNPDFLICNPYLKTVCENLDNYKNINYDYAIFMKEN